MKIVKNVKKSMDIPTICSVPVGTVFSLQDSPISGLKDEIKSRVWFKAQDDYIICLDDGECFPVYGDGSSADEIFDPDRPVRILNATLTVED